MGQILSLPETRGFGTVWRLNTAVAHLAERLLFLCAPLLCVGPPAVIAGRQAWASQPGLPLGKTELEQAFERCLIVITLE